ncbi:succinate dehydrogenase [bacterium]|nr:succinate dehydrogenase [bacterium]
MSATTVRNVTKPKANYETTAWKWMRYSGFLLIPLVWGHVLLQDIIVGVHKIDLDYVALRWASVGWRIYDTLLLGFAFAHGTNGIRQVLNDFIHQPEKRKILNVGLFIFWIVITAIGGIALIGGVRPIP